LEKKINQFYSGSHISERKWAILALFLRGHEGVAKHGLERRIYSYSMIL
jgi:hypothetical protein